MTSTAVVVAVLVAAAVVEVAGEPCVGSSTSGAVDIFIILIFYTVIYRTGTVPGTVNLNLYFSGFTQRV